MLSSGSEGVPGLMGDSGRKENGDFSGWHMPCGLLKITRV